MRLSSNYINSQLMSIYQIILHLKVWLTVLGEFLIFFSKKGIKNLSQSLLHLTLFSQKPQNGVFYKKVIKVSLRLYTLVTLYVVTLYEKLERFWASVIQRTWKTSFWVNFWLSWPENPPEQDFSHKIWPFLISFFQKVRSRGSFGKKSRQTDK